MKNKLRCLIYNKTYTNCRVKKMNYMEEFMENIAEHLGFEQDKYYSAREKMFGSCKTYPSRNYTLDI